MAIVPLQKLTLYGHASQRDTVMVGLQELGCLHLIDLPARNLRESWEHPQRNNMRLALRYLEACPEQRPQVAAGTQIDAGEVSNEALKIAEEQRTLQTERDDLRLAIKNLEPWGDFRLPDRRTIGDQQLWFYRVPFRQLPQFIKACALPRTLINRDSQHEYWVVVSAVEPESLPVAPQSLDERPLSQLRQRLAEIDDRWEELQMQRLALTRWCVCLRDEIAAAEDEAVRRTAAGLVYDDGPVFAVQGWIAPAKLPGLQEFAQRYQLALTVAEPAADENPPTLLKNPPLVAGAEGAVTFYMTPDYRSWDPTWVMYFSFSLFFAMIMADAGYGILMLILLTMASGRMRASASLRSLWNLAMFMSIVTFGYGVLIGSYFGFSPPSGGFLERLVWKSGGKSIMENREAMMVFSAAIGVFHLAIANIITAWRRKGHSQALSNVGWAMVLVAGLAMAVSRLSQPAFVPWLAEKLSTDSASLGTMIWTGAGWVLGCGLVMIFLFTSGRPLFSKKGSDWLWRPLEGFMGLTNISKAFGDALSYLRLFALGLASAQLAITFNGLAADVAKMQGVGLLLGLLIFILGHTLNFVLGIVGGVVHGLRLNCIEFFSWSLTDEGYPFHAFRKKAEN